MSELIATKRFMALSKEDKRLIQNLRNKMERDSNEKKSLIEVMDKMNKWKNEIDSIISEFSIKVTRREEKRRGFGKVLMKQTNKGEIK